MGDHQDWDNQILNKTKPGKASKKKVILCEKHSHLVKMEQSTGEDGFHHDTVTYSLRMQIQQARNANKMKQKELANAIGVQPNIITDYESGKAIPNPQMLNKLSKTLGVKFKK